MMFRFQMFQQPIFTPNPCAWRGHGRSRRLIAPICGGGVHLVPPPWPCGYVHDLGAADEAWIMLGRIFVGFHQWGYPIAGWFTMEIPFTRMIRGYPYFRKPPYWGFCAETNIGLHFGDKNWRKYDRKNWQFYRDPTGRTCWWFSFRYPLVI